jgi:hypothetical protein
MKTNFLVLIAILLFASCTSDDDNNSNEIESQLLGKWLFENPENTPTTNNYFTFTSSGNVTYSYWDGGQGANYLSETGTFSFNGDVMTMTFPEDVTLTFVQEVVYINDNVVEFRETGVSGENAYDGDYFRDGADSYDTPISTEGALNVFFDTGNVLNSAFGSDCYELSSPDENINVKLTFISDGEEISSETFSSIPGYQIHEVEELDGNIVSVKLRLEDFNPNVLDKDIIIYDIGVKIENQNEDVLISEFLGELYYCTESRYEVVFTYNKLDNTFSVEEQIHSF